jgi:MmyB-like transcription regulator ligand binding domain
VCLHPYGLASRTLNFQDWSTYLLGQLRRASVLTGDAELQRLAEEVLQYPNVPQLGDWRRSVDTDELELLIPVRLDVDGVELSLFTTMTTFGTPQDITLDEVAVELFFPADDESDELLRRAGQLLPNT